MVTSEKKRVSPAGKIGIWHCTAVVLSEVQNKCTDLDMSVLYILMSGTFGKFARKKIFCSARRFLSAVLLERWP